MSKHPRTLATGAIVVAGLAAAPALYAQDDLRMPHASMMGQGGMMGEGGMMDGMVDSMMSGLMTMIGMSGDLDGMMEHCNAMMQGMDGGHLDRPNEQWRRGERAPQEDLQPRADRR